MIEFVNDFLEYVTWLLLHCRGDANHAMSHLFTMYWEMKELQLI